MILTINSGIHHCLLPIANKNGAKGSRPYLNDGFLEIDNDTAKRSMKPMALGRKGDRFMGSEHGGKSATIADIPIEAAKLGRLSSQRPFLPNLKRPRAAGATQSPGVRSLD